MSLKPQPPRPMPPEIAAWGAKHLADDDPYKLIGDLLYEDYCLNRITALNGSATT
jgi:hypothetical protein